MEFSIRDGDHRPPILISSALRSESGQGTIEYVLVLVVAVAIIMGGLYQLNTAFKSWANNYFGDYLACLLETGELPTIGGSPGDSGVCDQLFKAFSLAEGRPLKDGAQQGEGGDGASGPAGAQRERGGGSGGGNYISARYGGGRFGSSTRSGSGPGSNRGRNEPTNTGNTGISNYGGGYSYYQRPQAKARTRLDNKFAFQNDRDETKKRIPVAAGKKSEDTGSARPPVRLKEDAFKKRVQPQADAGFTVGNFIRIIIIAAIIIALVMFLGGQVLSISKSME